VIYVRKRFVLVFVSIFFGIMLVPVYGALRPEVLTEDSLLEVGDRVRVLVGQNEGRIGEISKILDYNSGMLYRVDGPPEIYSELNEYYANQLERVELYEEFRGINDLIKFLRPGGRSN